MDVKKWVKQRGGVAVICRETGLTRAAVYAWITKDRIPPVWRMAYGIDKPTLPQARRVSQ